MTIRTQFGHAANVYDTYRPGYPQAIYDKIFSALPPPRHTALDLGSGTGKFAHGLLNHFDTVIGLEPDAQMAARLRENEPRVVVRTETAEAAHFDAASIDLVTTAHALHWMEPAIVLARVTQWLRPAGIFAVCGGVFPNPPGAIEHVVRGEFEDHWRHFRDERVLKHLPEEVLRSEPRMTVLELLNVPYAQTLSVADFTGYCRSTSYGIAYARSLQDPDAYFRDLESRFRAAQPNDKVQVDFTRWLMLLKKTG
jgi:SAM-dependent methyltransferase